MPSVGHLAVGFAAGRLEAGRLGPRRMTLSMLLWASLSVLPDADVVAFSLGIPYGAPWGHRGAAHSLAAAAVVALGAAAVARATRHRAGRAFAFAFVVMGSHGVLDAMTDGGRGVALLWPFSDHRWFLPWRPIPVAPLGPAFFSSRGMACIAVELVLFMPFLVYAFFPRRRAA